MQIQQNKPRVRYIEFMGHPNGSAGVVIFKDQNQETMGNFPLKRFGLEVLAAKIDEWLEQTDPINVLNEAATETIELTPNMKEKPLS